MIQTICKSTDFRPNDAENCARFINKATELTVMICPTDFRKISIGGYGDIIVKDEYMQEYYEEHPDCNSDGMDIFIEKLQEFLPKDESVAIQVVEYETSDTDYHEDKPLIKDINAYGIMISRNECTDLNVSILLNDIMQDFRSKRTQGDQ